LFSYRDTQRYRLGANFTKIDINRPKNTVVNYNQDGSLRNTKQGGDINFQPSRTNKVAENSNNKAYQMKINGFVQQARIKKENNFAQAGELYLSFSEPMRANLIKHLSGDLNKVKDKMIKAKIVGHFYMANQEFGMRLAQATGVTREDVEKAMKM
jgi:catalase